MVGSAIGFLCAANSLDDIVLLNRTKSKAIGEALDISNAIPKNSNYTIIGTDNYSEIIQSKIIIITASTGVYKESRTEIINAQVKMVKSIGQKIKKNCKSPLILIISNPIDVLTYFFLKETNYPRKNVIGIASSLDSSRFRYLLSKKLNIKKSNISNAFVIGEHGDTMVPIFSKLKINGKSSSKLLNLNQKKEITKEIRDYWKVLRNFKSRSQFGIAKKTFDVIESLYKNKSIKIPASILLEGEFGEKEVCMGVPLTITTKGVSKIQQIKLDNSEQESFKLSAQAIRNNIRSVEVKLKN